MKYIRQKLSKMIMSLLILLMITPLSVQATSNTESYDTSVAVQEEIQPRSDVLLVKIGVDANGQQLKRRWNATRQCWYDPYWVPIDQPFPI